MFQVLRRIGLLRRRWVWGLLLLGGIALAIYWLVPWRGAGAELQLVALRADGTFADSVRGVPFGAAGRAGADGDSVARAPDRPDTLAAAVARTRRGVPLVLGIANTGTSRGRPDRLTLSFPRWYRLVEPGPGVRRELIPDEPLQRYVIEGDFPPIQPGRVPTILPLVDTLWLEPWLPDYYCTADVDSVPQLMPSTSPDTAGGVAVRIFYSFDGDALPSRQTGLLTVELPDAMFRRSAPADIAMSPVQLVQPRAERPPLGALLAAGSRDAECGPPGDPMRIFSALWLTADSGRMISVHYGGQPRKEYYDLNRDSVIELEMWDPDGDGEMEAWRTMRLPIPEYMLPVPPPPPPAVASVDSLRPDSPGSDSARPAFAGRTMPAGAAPDIATLGRLLLPGDLATARRLFVRRVPQPRPQPDGLLGQPLDRQPVPVAPPAAAGQGEQPDRAVPVPEPQEQEPPEAEPEQPEPPRRKVPIGQPIG